MEFISLLLQVLPNIVFIFAVLGIILIILRHLPEAISHAEQDEADNASVEQRLLDKGLPAVAISKVTVWLKLSIKKIWLFMLEAKDLKPTAVTGYRIRKLFRTKHEHTNENDQSKHTVSPHQESSVEDEQTFLDKIQSDPKNLGNYAGLAKYYASKGNYQEALDLYHYLVKHESGNAEYHSKLAFTLYQLGNYEKSAKHFEQSISLDPTQPNRYYNLGVNLDLMGKSEAAVKAFEQAIALEQKNSRYYLSLANAYIKLGNKDRAKVILRQARKVDPGNTEIEEKINQFQ